MFIFASAILLATRQQSANLASDSRLDKHVTFQTTAAAAPVVVAGLAKAAGLPLKAGALMKDEILLMRVRDASLRETMERLGRACAGSWVLENGTYYLTRTPADDVRTLAASHAEFVAGMKTELAKVAKEATEQTPFTSQSANDLVKKLNQLNAPNTGENAGPQIGNFASRTKIEAGFPAGRLAAKIISRLDAETIASAPSLKRTVLSTNPTKMESPLTCDIADAVAAFMPEANQWADAISQLSEEAQSQLFSPFSARQAHVPGPPAKVNVIIDRDYMGLVGVNLSVKVYDKAGAVIGVAQRMLRIDDPGKSIDKLIPDPKEQKLSIPPEEMAVMGVLSQAMGGPSGKTFTISAEIRNRLMHPEKFEPLATSPSTLTLGAAEAKNLNVVADLPDLFLILGTVSARNGMPSATSFLNLLQALPPGTCPSRIEGGWLEIDGGTGPGDNMFIHRDNREELSRLFNSGDGSSLSTEALARFAFGGGGTRADFLWLELTTVLCPVSEFEDDTRWRMLYLLGSLMHSQADTPVADGRIPFSKLDPDSLAIVRDISFFHDPRFITYNNRFMSTECEPCELLPNGLPPDGYIDLKSSAEEVAYSAGARPEAITASQLAMNTLQKNHPGKFGDYVPTVTTTDKFRVGSKRIVNLTIHLDARLTCQMKFEELHPPTGDAVSFDQLPETFRTAVKRTLDNFEGHN